MAEQTSNESYAAIKPLHEAFELCGDYDKPPRVVGPARRATVRIVQQTLKAIDNVGRARLAALDNERKALNKALATWRGVLQESLDQSAAVWRRMEAAAAHSRARAVGLEPAHR